MTESLVARLALQMLPGFGAAKVRKSFEFHLDPSLSAYEALEQLARGTPTGILQNAVARTRQGVQQSQDLRIEILALDDDRYPYPLRTIPDAPPFIHVRGSLPDDWSRAVAIIGTREISEYASGAINETIEALASDPLVIVVSGLAIGADAIAHRAALECKLRTVAVLAHGLDSVYPKPNRELAEEILESGCWISEHLAGEPLSKFFLVARDRMQSGLSIATIVSQTSVTGGSMHTALFTLQQKRQLIALDPPTESPEWLGNSFLISKTTSPNFTEKSLDKFKKFDRPYAIRMTRKSIKGFVEAGLQTNFTPKRADRDGLLINALPLPPAPIHSLSPPSLLDFIAPHPSEAPVLSMSGKQSKRDLVHGREAQKPISCQAGDAIRLPLLGFTIDNFISERRRAWTSCRLTIASGFREQTSDDESVFGPESELAATLRSFTSQDEIVVSLAMNAQQSLKAIEVEFKPSLSAELAMDVLNTVFATVSGACALAGGEPLHGACLHIKFDLESELVKDDVSEIALNSERLQYPTVMHKLVVKYDDVVRIKSAALGFQAALALLEEVLGEWNHDVKGHAKAAKLGKVDLSKESMASGLIDLPLNVQTYGDLLRHFRQFRVNSRKRPIAEAVYERDVASARAVLVAALKHLLSKSRDVYRMIPRTSRKLK